MSSTTQPTVEELPSELANHPRFQILRQLGQGGMGVVYQAQHRLMDRMVAIKIIRSSVLDNPEALARFHGEVKAAAKLQHPNIVAAYDAEQAGSLWMLVMEYVEGLNLARVLEKKGPLSVHRSCQYIHQAALGLQHAFEQGMVHRDIKPQNLMLTPKRQVKILDFGLARLASERQRGGGLTQDGAFMGTPEFVAPEQATDARTADIRADIYSLGCTLYCLLTGQTPFVEDTAVKYVLAHIEKPAPSLTEKRADVPQALAGIVARMLAKNPADRFQTPAHVAQALSQFCEVQPDASAPPVVKPVPQHDRVTKVGGDTSRTPPAIPQRPVQHRHSQPPRPAVQKKVAAPRPVEEDDLPIVKQARNWPIYVAAGLAGCALLIGLPALWFSGVFKTSKVAVQEEGHREAENVRREKLKEPVNVPPPKLEEKPRKIEPAAPRRPAFLKISPVKDVLVAAKQTITVPVHVERGNGEGNIELTLENLPQGVWGHASIIRPGSTQGEFECIVAPWAADGNWPIRLRAKEATSSAELQFRLTVGTFSMAERINEYAEATRLSPSEKTGWLNLGHMYQLSGKLDKALASYDRAIALDSMDALALGHRGMARPPQQAFPDLNRAVELSPNDAILRDARGVCLHRQRQGDRALKDFEEAIGLDSRYTLAYVNRGNVYAGKNQYDAAIADYDRAIELDPRCAGAYTKRAAAYAKKSELDRAILDYKLAIDLDPNDATAYNARGTVYLSKGQDDLALQDFDKAINLNANFAMAFDNRAVVYRNKRNYDAAANDLNRAIQLSPRFALAFCHRGQLNHEKGQYNNAIHDFTQAISIDANLAEAFRGRAGSYDALQNKRRAVEDRKRAKQLEQAAPKK
jgi:serine/threonine protein kinase/tetratricopeptide (TPR) repeat protein